MEGRKSSHNSILDQMEESNALKRLQSMQIVKRLTYLSSTKGWELFYSDDIITRTTQIDAQIADRILRDCEYDYSMNEDGLKHVYTIKSA